MSVAIEISPELMIMDKPNGASYRLDSGEEDFNRVIASDKLDTLNFIDIPVDGFDTYLYFEDLGAVASFVKSIKVNGDAVDVTPHTTERTEEGTIVIVYGKVSIVLSDSKSQTIELCRPVYRVYPDKKENTLFPVQDIRRYINKAWTEECKEALFHSGTDAVQRFGVVKRLKESEKLQLNLLKMVLALATLVIVIIAVGAMFKDNGAIRSANAGQASAPTAIATASSLMNANNQNAAALPLSTNPSSAVYGGGFTGQEGQASVEDFARLQVEQTQGMLKEMGVDVQSGSQNLGCFAEDKS